MSLYNSNSIRTNDKFCVSLYFLLSINDLCFRPDGSQLIVAAGNKVLVYEPLDGSLIKALPGKLRLNFLSQTKIILNLSSNE